MFNNARIKLTAWYLMIIMGISMSFSFVIFRVLTSELDRFASLQKFRIERRLNEGDLHFGYNMFNPPIIDNELIEETKTRLAFNLLVINMFIFMASGATGYFLAGRTLMPIKNMIDEQNRFISDASHELKTPLTSLKAAMEVYLRGGKKTLKDAVEIMVENIAEVDKLQKLAESLLLLTKYQKINGGLKPTSVSLKEAINTSIKKIKPLADNKGITIESFISDFKINCDKDSLISLTTILLDNGVKYGHTGGTITVKTKETDGNVQISFADDGIGIAPKDIPQIFNRFYRADASRTKSSENGYGLGLSIAKQIADLFNGKIEVKSKLNKGSVFTVIFPVL
jgi:two-component system, OmpR family, sensor histidine kinase CiaH